MQIKTITQSTDPVSLDRMAYLINTLNIHDVDDKGGMNLHIIISNFNRADLCDPDKDLRRARIIIRDVCEKMGVSKAELVTRKTRQSIFIFSKMLTTYFIRKHTDLTFSNIAEFIWHGPGPAPHHSTIIHLCKVCQDMIDSFQSKHDFYRKYTILSQAFVEIFDNQEQ